MSKLRQMLRDEYGGMIVESALVFPVLITIGIGGIDASYMLIQNHKVEGHLAVAANFLSKSDMPENHETTARNLAVTGNPDGNGDPIIKGWSTEQVRIKYITTANNNDSYRSDGDVRTIEISTSLDYKGFGLLSSILPETPRLSARVQERIVGGGR